MGSQARLRNQIDAMISSITELIAVIWDSDGSEDTYSLGCHDLRETDLHNFQKEKMYQ